MLLVAMTFTKKYRLTFRLQHVKIVSAIKEDFVINTVTVTLNYAKYEKKGVHALATAVIKNASVTEPISSVILIFVLDVTQPQTNLKLIHAIIIKLL